MTENVTTSRAHMEHEHHHHSSLSYWVIWGVLLILTAVTVWTGRMDLPNFGLILAMIIATTKATLVVLFFMHLYEQKGVNRVTFVATIAFVIVLLLGVFGDLMTRISMALPERERVNIPGEPRNVVPPDTSTTGH